MKAVLMALLSSQRHRSRELLALGLAVSFMMNVMMLLGWRSRSISLDVPRSTSVRVARILQECKTNCPIVNHLQHLVVVPGHAVFIGSDYSVRGYIGWLAFGHENFKPNRICLYACRMPSWRMYTSHVPCPT